MAPYVSPEEASRRAVGLEHSARQLEASNKELKKVTKAKSKLLGEQAKQVVEQNKLAGISIDRGYLKLLTRDIQKYSAMINSDRVSTAQLDELSGLVWTNWVRLHDQINTAARNYETKNIPLPAALSSLM